MKRLSHDQIASLVKSAQQGDSAAFAMLYAATVENQLYFATAFLKDSFLAEDVVQEVYISLYRSLSKLDNPKLFVAYLNRICYNACVDYKKKAARQKYELDEASFLQVCDDSVGNNPDERYAALEQSSELHQALAKLEDKFRAVFLMRYYHNMRIREISITMNCSESTVKRYIRSATEQLRSNLEATQTC